MSLFLGFAQQAPTGFCVIDTEGKSSLREIAIVNDQGQVIYEAFNRDSFDQLAALRDKAKSLTEILLDIQPILRSNRVVFHFAKHDLQVLKNSFKSVKLQWQNLEFECTYELARTYLPTLQGYGLEFLSKFLNLQVDNRIFNGNFAHSARYDALFTYELYRALMNHKHVLDHLKQCPNPFASNRVDDPFKNHPDFKSAHQDQFERLKAVLEAIGKDSEHCSQGVIVLGVAGSGKTHLIMRLAQELLRTNRLLFVRQPNNPNAIFFHIYSRVLESFIERVPGSSYTQLEHLIAHSFVRILEQLNRHKSPKIQEILDRLGGDHLKLFNLIEAGGSQQRLAKWRAVESQILNWWSSHYSGAGNALNILKGLIKFCNYVDVNKRNLVTRWLVGHDLEPEELGQIGLSEWDNNEMGREDLALDALSVFGKLSILDEPLILVFDQLEGLALDHNYQILLSFGEAIKEIFTHVPNTLVILNLYPSRWQQYQEQWQSFFEGSVVGRFQLQVELTRPPRQQLEQILTKKLEAIPEVQLRIGDLFDPPELEDILGKPSVRDVINRASDYYQHQVHGIPLPPGTPSYPGSGFKPDQSESDPKFISERLAKIEKDQAKILSLLEQLICLQGDNDAPPEEVTESKADSTPGPLPSPPPSVEKLLAYLTEQEEKLKTVYNKPTIIDDSDDIGKLNQIVRSFKLIENLQIEHLRLGRRKIPEHLVIRTHKRVQVMGLLQIGGSSFTARIRNFNSLVVSYKNYKFCLLRDIRQAPITGRVGKEEIDRLNHAPNGEFRFLEQADRVEFELLYTLIIDIQNQDLEMDLQEALTLFLEERPQHWLVEKIVGTIRPDGFKTGTE